MTEDVPGTGGRMRAGPEDFEVEELPGGSGDIHRFPEPGRAWGSPGFRAHSPIMLLTFRRRGAAWAFEKEAVADPEPFPWRAP